MSSNVAGYLAPTDESLPGGLTLVQYIQQVIVGITGMDGKTVRPKWQKNAPKEPPAAENNWCAFGINETGADLDAYQEQLEETTQLQVQEQLTIDLSFYGPNSYKNAKRFRDGLKISQNRDALRAGKMGFKETTNIINVPEMFGGLWYSRHDINLIVSRQDNKTFDILTFTSANGNVEALKSNEETENIPWNVSEQ